MLHAESGIEHARKGTRQTFCIPLLKLFCMKNFFTLLLSCLTPVVLMAQIGVGTTSLDATAMLQVNASASTNAKGFLGPRVALTSTSANSPFSVTPATGTMVYNTATAGSGSTAVTPGYYSFNGTSWDRLAAQPVTFVDGSPGTLPLTNQTFSLSSNVAPSLIGTITLPPGRWEIKARYSILVNAYGSFYGGSGWVTFGLQY